MGLDSSMTLPLVIINENGFTILFYPRIYNTRYGTTTLTLKKCKAFFLFIRIERIPETLKHYWLHNIPLSSTRSRTLPALRPCRRSFKEQEVLVHSVWPSKKMRKRTKTKRLAFQYIKKMPSQIPRWQGQSPFYFSFSTRHNVKTRK